VSGFIYFIKAKGGRAGGEGGEAFFYAWAERVRRIDGRLRGENIQVPVVSWGEGRWLIRGRQLPTRTFDGHAYPIRRPEWHTSDTPVSQPPFAASRRAALEQRLHTTPLGRMCLHPEVRLALAQDKLAAALEPMLRVPDLLAGEDQLAEAWRRDRPEAAANADAGAETLAPSCSASTEVGLWRRRLRFAALRRLDAAAVGREIYVPCPAFFGEPYLNFASAPEFSFKAGLVRTAKTWPNPASEALSRAWRADAERIAAAESWLFPVLSCAGGRSDAEVATALALWLALTPVRDFEARSSWPLFPPASGSPDQLELPGFKVRIRPETMRELGGSYRTLATAGLSPYLAEPFADYCETQRDLLAAWSEDVAGLAMAKWGDG